VVTLCHENVGEINNITLSTTRFHHIYLP